MGTSSASSMISDAPTSNIDGKIDQVDHQLNRLQDLLDRAHRVLTPVMTPDIKAIDPGKAIGATSGQLQSPLADVLSMRAARIEQQVDTLRDLLDRVEA